MKMRSSDSSWKPFSFHHPGDNSLRNMLHLSSAYYLVFADNTSGLTQQTRDKTPSCILLETSKSVTLLSRAKNELQAEGWIRNNISSH